jgi:regulatory protein
MWMIPEAIDQIIFHLLQHNFLNETRFAEAFARGKFRVKKWGKTRIIRELKYREISQYNITLALKEIPEDEYFLALRKKNETASFRKKPSEKKKKTSRLSTVSWLGIKSRLGKSKRVDLNKSKSKCIETNNSFIYL